MRRVILMLMLMSLTLAAEAKVYNGSYKGFYKEMLTGDSFNYIVTPQKQECESLWDKNKDTIYLMIYTTLNDKAMLDVLNKQKLDLKGLRVINKKKMEEYVPDASWESYHKFTMFYLFSSLDACNAALPTIKEEAVVMKEKAKEISEKMREKHDRILKENKETVE
ncbi:hypothetical protein [Sulfurimonas sp.]|uniref:hypothetical protein n=1 Tax=Sulfurimonas sp. TaxID=2022749 RepID=UPI00286DC1BD|nr:hypothetical protein [Sulfurimonas sp.]